MVDFTFFPRFWRFQDTWRDTLIYKKCKPERYIGSEGRQAGVGGIH